MQLSSLFTDHAVLQRDTIIPIWGWSTPNTVIKAVFNGQSLKTVSSPTGKFTFRFAPSACGGPYKLTVLHHDGSNAVTINDILIGEVWVASGQSNMQMSLTQMKEIDRLSEELTTRENIRFINIPRTAYSGKVENFSSAWEPMTPETAGECSAVAFHFADKLETDLNIPIGIIHSSWGGSVIESWTSREAIIQNPIMGKQFESDELTIQQPTHWQELPDDGWEDPISNIECNRSDNFIGDPGITEPAFADFEFDDSGWKKMNIPQPWQNAGHNHNGVCWFRKKINIDDSWLGKDLIITLGAIDKHDITFFNGHKIGGLGSGFDEEQWSTTRVYNIPCDIVKAGENIIVVRVFSFFGMGGMLGPAKDLQLSLADKLHNSLPLTGAWKYKMVHNTGNAVIPKEKLGPGNMATPAIIFNNMIYPLLSYAIRGVVWYQGESNVSRCHLYHQQLRNLINDWRYLWGQEAFPFYIVQVANFLAPSNYQHDSQWALLREAQSKVARELPNSGLATTIDIGETWECHPKNKTDVGLRLAQLALCNIYGKPITATGPLYRAMLIEGNSIRLLFDNIGSALVAKGELKTFVIAGKDGKFLPATAKLEGCSIVVSSDKIARPKAVRYAWADNPDGCNLYNSEGLPASPFRTDDK